MTKESVHAWKKLLHWIAGSTALVLLILLSLHSLIPEIISRETVQEKIKTALSASIPGRVDFKTLEVSLLPLPEAVIRGGSLSLPGAAEFRVESAIIVPRVLSLLAGKVRIKRVQLYAPQISVILHNREKRVPFSLEELKKQISDGLNALSEKAYGMRIDLKKGTLHLSDRDGPLLSLQDLHGKADVSDDLRIALTSTASFSKKMQLDVRMNPAAFKGIAALTLSGVNPQLAIHRLLPDLRRYVGDSEGDVSLSLRINGQKDIRADVKSSFRQITLLSKGEKIPLVGIGMSSTLVLAEDRQEVVVNELKMERPRLALRGTLVFEKNPRNIILEISGSDMDMWPLRHAALTAAGQVSIIRDIFSYVRGGEVPFVTVRSRGASVEDLGRTENIFITSAIQKGNIYIPGPQLGFEEVNAECVISRGILEAKNVLATLGKTKVRDCKVRVGLKGRDVPLHIDAAFTADLAETKDLLRRVIKNQEFTREIDRVRRVEGKVAGRIVLGENTASLKPRIDLSALSFTADHQQVPFPITVTKGAFSYTDTLIGIKKLEGTLGRSSFKDITAELRTGDTASLQMSSGNIRIEQDEFFPWLKSLEGLKRPLESIRSMGGVMTLDVHHLSGPLENPGAWRFKLAGGIKDLTVDSSFWPEPVFLEKGMVTADEGRFSLKDFRANILDGRLVISGSHQGYTEDLTSQTEFDIRGEMGPRFLEWAAEFAGLPPQLSLKDPLTFEHAHIVLGKGAVLFEGKWKVRDGPDISASVLKDTKGLTIRDLIIMDADSEATLSADLRDKSFTLDFAGKLSPETLNKIIAGQKFRGGKIEGDFHTSFGSERPFSFQSLGKLDAKNISFPLKEGVPLAMKHLSIDGNGSRLSINSSSSLDGNPFSVHGTLNSTPRAIVVDMDFSADRIEWERIEETAKKLGKKEDRKTDKEWELPVEGSIRVKANSLSYGSYIVTPLNAEMALRRNALDIAINRSSLCGISFLGTVGVTPAALSMDLQLSAKDAEVEKALGCFDLAENEILTGTFDLNARVKAQGEKEDLLSSLTGDIELSARDGRIYREVSLLKIFDFLEVTQVLTGLPQMRQEGVAYKSITAKGEFGSGLLEMKEVVMDCPSLKIAAQGSVDLKKEVMDFGVLVCPFKRTNLIISKIPIVGGILGGGFASIPLKVTGDLSAPKVSSSPVSSVGAGLLGILGRTIQAPVKLFDPFVKGEKKK